VRIGRLLLALLIACASVVLTASYQTSPEFEVSPSSGEAGDTITATGKGFEAGDIELFLDTAGGLRLGTTPVDRNGEFVERFSVPRVNAGGHDVIACLDRNRTTNECRQAVRAVLTIVDPPPPTTTTTTTTTTTSTTTTTTQPPIGVTTTAATTTTSEPPIGIATTTTLPTGPGDVAITTTTLGGDPGAPNEPQVFVSPTVTTFPPEAVPTQISNLSITAVEVTQGLQNFANDFPLVENRWTAVRIHGVTDAEAQAGISGAVELIRVSDGNANLGIEHASNLATYTKLINRVDINGSPYILLDPEYAQGTVLIRAWIYAGGDVDASNEPTSADNLFEVTVEFHDVEPVHVYYWPLYLEEDFDPDGDPIIWTAGDGYLAEHLTAYRLWPVNAFFAHPMDTVVGNADSDFNLNFDAENSGAANTALQELWELAGHQGNHLYNAMVSPEFANDTDPYKGRASSGTTWTMMGLGYSGSSPFRHRSGEILTHESGHYFGLPHAPCSFTVGNPIPNEVPGGAIDPTFPGSYGWPDCSLAPTDPEGYYGIDVLWGITPAAGPTIMTNNAGTEGPNVAFPFMGYKAPRWLDPWHGCFILDQLGVDCDQQEDTGVFDPSAPGGGGIPDPVSGIPKWTCQDIISEIDMCTYFPTPSGNPIPAEPNTDWLVHVALDVSDPLAPSAELQAMRIDARPHTHDDDEAHDHHDELSGRTDRGGPHVLALVDDSDVAIWATTLHVEDEGIDVDGDLGDHFQFVERVPAIDEGVELALLAPSGTIVRLGPTGNPPELSVRRVVDGDSLSIRLDVSDPDGDPVRTVALYRPNPDAEWTPVAPSTTKRRIDLPDTSDLPGSDNGELRLIASDGWHTVETTVNGIEIPDHAPKLTVIQPFTESIPAGRAVRLEVQALDPEDGMLDGSAVSWSSNVDGPLGAGAAVTTRVLAEGPHVLTVVATDSAGNTATGTVELEITQTDIPAADVQAALAAVFAGDVAIGATDVAAPADDGSDDDGSGFPALMILILVSVAGLGGVTAWRIRQSTE